MPNFDVWDALVPIIILVTTIGLPAVLLNWALPRAIKEIRKMWYNADPRDDHRDR